MITPVQCTGLAVLINKSPELANAATHPRRKEAPAKTIAEVAHRIGVSTEVMELMRKNRLARIQKRKRYYD